MANKQHLFDTKGYKVIQQWLEQKGNQPFTFQEETWQQIIEGNSGLVNAPTGCGKTFSVFLGALIDFINDNPKDHLTKTKNGLQLLWITPLRALAKDIGRAMEEVIFELGMNWKIGIRNGDTSATHFFREKTTDKLMAAFAPVIKSSLDKTDATKYYSDVINTYNNFPTTFKKLNPDLPGFVTGKATDALFDLVAKEELNIRQNIAARTTDLLRKVFGAKW